MNSSALESRDHGLENTTLDKVRRRYRHRQAHSTFEHFNLNFRLLNLKLFPDKSAW